jgi:hypothetical protein
MMFQRFYQRLGDVCFATQGTGSREDKNLRDSRQPIRIAVMLVCLPVTEIRGIAQLAEQPLRFRFE